MFKTVERLHVFDINLPPVKIHLGLKTRENLVNHNKHQIRKNLTT